MSSSDEEDLVLLLLLNSNDSNNINRRKYWVHPYSKKNAESFGIFSVAKELALYPEKFHSFYRMSQESFKLLCDMVQSSTGKRDTNFRRAISVEERLLITLKVSFSISFKLSNQLFINFYLVLDLVKNIGYTKPRVK